MYNTGKLDAPTSSLPAAAVLTRVCRLWRAFRFGSHAHAYLYANWHANVDTQPYADPDAAARHC